MELEQFTAIQIEVPSCGVIVEAGTEFALDYQLSSAYEIKEMGVENGTFIFRCKHRYPAALVHWDWKANFVHLTFPEGTQLGEVRISNVSGPITAAGIHAAQLDVRTVSGKLELEESEAELFSAKTTSGALTLHACSAEQFDCGAVSGSVTGGELHAGKGTRCHSTSGAIHLTGELRGHTDCKTVSGSIHLKGDVQGSLDLRSTSGGVEVDLEKELEGYSYSLHSVSGGRMVNGQNSDGGGRRDAPNSITVHTVSGGIRLNFAG